MSLFRRRQMELARSKIVRFEDKKTEALCLKFFDKKNKGYLTIDDLKEVTYLSKDFGKDNLAKEIIKFNEFKYFGVTDVYYLVFQTWKKLEEIELPPTWKIVEQKPFFGVGQTIKKFIIPEGIEILGNSCFTYAIAPNTTIVIPSTIKEIRESAFGRGNNNTYIFKGKVPPNMEDNLWNYSSFSISVGYAPDESVEDYKKTKGIMLNMCSDILPISQYKE